MDPNIYDLLMAQDEPDARAQAQALAGGYDRERALGILGQLTGDKVLSGVGGSLNANAARREAMLAEAPGQRMRQLLDKQRLAAGQAELTSDNAPASSVYRDLAKKFGTALPPETTNRQAKEFLTMAEKAYAADQRAQELRLNRDAMRGQREDAAAAREAARKEAAAAKQAETDTKERKDLAEDLDKFGAPGFYQKQGEASAIINENPDDLPGFGIAHKLAPKAIANFFTSEKGIALQQSVGQMLSQYRKGETGSGMSDAERTEYGQITGLLDSGDERRVIQGVERLTRAMDARVAARASATPRAAEQYGERQPWVKEALRTNGRPTEPSAQGPEPAQPGTVRMRNRKGQLVDVPAAKVKEALAKRWTEAP